MRKTFDLASGYTIGKHLHTLDERSVLIRCIFLETVAGNKINRNSMFYVKVPWAVARDEVVLFCRDVFQIVK